MNERALLQRFVDAGFLAGDGETCRYCGGTIKGRALPAILYHTDTCVYGDATKLLATRVEYPHLVICSGDRRYPAGVPGHSCCCLNLPMQDLIRWQRAQRLSAKFDMLVDGKPATMTQIEPAQQPYCPACRVHHEMKVPPAPAPYLRDPITNAIWDFRYRMDEQKKLLPAPKPGSEDWKVTGHVFVQFGRIFWK